MNFKVRSALRYVASIAGASMRYTALLLLPALLCSLVVRILELRVRRREAIQVVGVALGGVTGGYWVLGAGWYIAAGGCCSASRWDWVCWQHNVTLATARYSSTSDNPA